MSSFFRGTAAGSDFRFQDKHAQLKKQIAGQAPAEFSLKISMSKVRKEGWLEQWVARTLTELLGIEDEIAASMVTNHLLTDNPDPKELAAVLSGVLEDKSVGFVAGLWSRLAEAQSHPSGMPIAWMMEQQAAAKAKQIMQVKNEAGLHISNMSNSVALCLGAGSSNDPRLTAMPQPPAAPPAAADNTQASTESRTQPQRDAGDESRGHDSRRRREGSPGRYERERGRARGDWGGEGRDDRHRDGAGRTGEYRHGGRDGRDEYRREYHRHPDPPRSHRRSVSRSDSRGRRGGDGRRGSRRHECRRSRSGSRTRDHRLQHTEEEERVADVGERDEFGRTRRGRGHHSTVGEGSGEGGGAQRVAEGGETRERSRERHGRPRSTQGRGAGDEDRDERNMGRRDGRESGRHARERSGSRQRQQSGPAGGRRRSPSRSRSRERAREGRRRSRRSSSPRPSSPPRAPSADERHSQGRSDMEMEAGRLEKLESLKEAAAAAARAARHGSG